MNDEFMVLPRHWEKYAVFHQDQSSDILNQYMMWVVHFRKKSKAMYISQYDVLFCFVLFCHIFFFLTILRMNDFVSTHATVTK